MTTAPDNRTRTGSATMMSVTAPPPASAARPVATAQAAPAAAGDEVVSQVKTDRLQQFLAAITVVIAWIWLRPLGFTGLNGVALALLALNSVFQLARLVPAGAIPRRAELPLFCIWAITAAALLSLRSLSIGAIFAYFVAGHAGYRLPLRPALSVAGLVGVLSALGLRLADWRGVEGWPWLLGLTVALPVFIGMANRSRDMAVTSALNAARSAQRAAESEAREQAQAERARISRDIHDVLAHSLSGVSMQLELSEMLLDGGDSARAREAIGKAHSMVREGMAEARRAITALRADVLPLAQTLQAQFWGVGDVEVVGEPRELPVETGQTLIRAAQEALTNTRRHAAGASVHVLLEYRADEVELQVTNGPPGDDARAEPGGSGMGLVGMRERAALLGGRVDAGPIVDGELAGGWRVTVFLPAKDESP